MNIIIRKASKDDYSAIVALLNDSSLPSADLVESSVELFVGIADSLVIASVGIERFGKEGLLRSLAVKPVYKNQRVGDSLVKHLLEYCCVVGVSELYLLTTTADSYFVKYGFVSVGRDVVPISVRQTKEFEGICPASAAVMYRSV